jgi:hypothetical protein
LRQRSLASLAAAVSGPRSRLRVLLTLRADFYDRPLAYQGFAELVRAGVETLVPLSPEELERAITHPAERAGGSCQPGLVAEMVADVAGQPGALPLLQFALTELFERRQDGALSLEAYRGIVGVAGVVARRAEELYQAASQDGRQATRQLLLRLVTVGEASEATRRRVPRAELASLEVDQQALGEVIDAFGRHRLLSFDRDPHTPWTDRGGGPRGAAWCLGSAARLAGRRPHRPADPPAVGRRCPGVASVRPRPGLPAARQPLGAV